jgi:catechol 2,3-dioxygenase-like lactoylglutathione lyase family enzyme
MTQTAADVAGRFGLGPIDQISFAVDDLDEAVPRYAALFGGDFEVMDVEMSDIFVRGQPASVRIRLGFGKTGPIEVELVQVVEGEYPIKDFLAEHGEGFHHVRFPVPDLKATQAAMEADGYTVTLEGASGELLFAYLESPHLAGGTIELIQFPSS